MKPCQVYGHNQLRSPPFTIPYLCESLVAIFALLMKKTQLSIDLEAAHLEAVAAYTAAVCRHTRAAHQVAAAAGTAMVCWYIRVAGVPCASNLRRGRYFPSHTCIADS